MGLAFKIRHDVDLFSFKFLTLLLRLDSSFLLKDCMKDSLDCSWHISSYFSL